MGEGDVSVGGDGNVQLEQRLSLLNGVTMIIGNIIGSGIFLTPKGVQTEMGSAGWSLIIWAVSGVLSMVGAICYAELGTTIPKSGASYSYIKEAFGPLLGFVRMWLSILIIEPTVQAAIAITFADYLIKPFFPTCASPYIAIRLVAALCCLLIIALNCISVRFATRIQDAFSYAKIIALIVIMIFGVISYAKHGTNVGSLGDPWSGSTVTAGSVALSMYSGLYSYAGWDTLNFMVEELKDPYKNLPRSIYISMPLCTIVYLLANLAYYAVLTPEELVSADAVALVFADKTMGRFSWIMSLFVAMSTFGALNSSFYASSRLFYVASREGHLPQYFSMVSPGHLTPIPALLLTGGLTLLYLCVENVFDLINYYSFMYWLTVGLSIVGQIYLRFKRPDMPRPIKFSLFYPFLFSALCVYLVGVPYFTETTDSLIGTAILATGFPVYFYFIHNNGEYVAACLRGAVAKVTVFLQKLVPVVAETLSDVGEM